MKYIKIQDIGNTTISGVQAAFSSINQTEENLYFTWTPTALTADFSTNHVTGGILKSWHHQPLFTHAERHIDNEMFYFLKGTTIMLFIDYADNIPDPDTAQIVRIPAGTQIIISKGKGHFVGVAEDDEPALAVVAAPPMEAPKTVLPQPVLGLW